MNSRQCPLLLAMMTRSPPQVLPDLRKRPAGSMWLPGSNFTRNLQVFWKTRYGRYGTPVALATHLGCHCISMVYPCISHVYPMFKHSPNALHAVDIWWYDDMFAFFAPNFSMSGKGTRREPEGNQKDYRISVHHLFVPRSWMSQVGAALLLH